MTRDCGVVLCYPLGHEYIQFHRAFRQLAVLLSESGFPVLRFDFTGCGDSGGDHNDWGIGQWVADVATAIEELRRRSAAARVCLAGMRLGGTIAMMAAAGRPDVDPVVLWDPVVEGRQYLEEITALHRAMLRYAHVIEKPATPAGNAAEILGFPLPAEFIAELEHVNLLATDQRPAGRILVIESNPRSSPEPLRKHLETGGMPVAYHRDFRPELWEWIEDFGRVHVPRPLLNAVVDWTGGGAR